ncbi:MAG: acyl-CoA thioesterase [Gemmatimonadota bacterium]
MEAVATARVIFGDTDAMGIAYYANYLRWFEIGRVELLRRRGMVYRELSGRGIHLPVTRAEIRYIAPARYDDGLVIRAGIRSVGRASVSFAYRIERDDGTPLAEGATTHAFTDGRGRIVRVPEGFPGGGDWEHISGGEGGSRGT